MKALKSANLVLMFILELVVLASPVIWTWTAFESLVPRIFVSFIILGALITAWIAIGAQRSTKPITLLGRSVRELVWFGAGFALLWLTGWHVVAIVFAVLVVVNLALRLVWQQLPPTRGLVASTVDEHYGDGPLVAD